MISVGSVVSGYRVQRILGSGGMGTVYAVADPELPRLDALKVMPAEFSTDVDFRKRFLREADIAATLDHPNIVSVYDRGETPEGQLWIAMQMVDGTDADQALQSGTMTPARAVHIVSAVGEALDYAHGKQVLHRDIKPANFLLSGPVGPDERVLLGDFGIARSADDAGLTATNAVMTTMAYAAPEVLEGGRVDHRSDLYSLGCALYQLLTGQTPYADTPGMAAQAMAHLRRPVPRPTAIRPGLAPEFDNVIATAMAKDPAQRFRSGRELAQAAAAALRAQNTPARGYAVPGVPGAAPQHSWPQTGQAEPSIAATTAPKKRGKLIAALVGAVVVVGGGVTAATVLGGSDSGPTPPASTTAKAVPAAPTVAAEALPTLVLPEKELSAIVGADAAASVETLKGFANDRVISGKECVALVYPMQESVYANSGATTGFAQISGERLASGDRGAVQAVIPFPTAELARSFMDRQAALWPGCEFKTIEIRGTPPTPNTTWRTGSTGYDDGILTTVKNVSGEPTSCQRALTAAGTVVVDVSVCLATGLADQAVTVARQIAEKVPV